MTICNSWLEPGPPSVVAAAAVAAPAVFDAKPSVPRYNVCTRERIDVSEPAPERHERIRDLDETARVAVALAIARRNRATTATAISLWCIFFLNVLVLTVGAYLRGWREEAAVAAGIVTLVFTAGLHVLVRLRLRRRYRGEVAHEGGTPALAARALSRARKGDLLDDGDGRPTDAARIAYHLDKLGL